MNNIMAYISRSLFLGLFLILSGTALAAETPSETWDPVNMGYGLPGFRVEPMWSTPVGTDSMNWSGGAGIALLGSYILTPHWEFRAGLDYSHWSRPNSNQNADVLEDTRNLLGASLAAVFRVTPIPRFECGLWAGLGGRLQMFTLASSPSGSPQGTVPWMGLGLEANLWVSGQSRIGVFLRGSADLAPALADDLRGDKARRLDFGLSWSTGFLLGDRDGDGVGDREDQCPDTPTRALVDRHGCPLDSDRDGVYDGQDRCPDTPLDALVDPFGCPTDRDKDGVFDGVDRCTETPVGVRVDKHGCPLDSDGDGVPDFLDECPHSLMGAKVDGRGCPLDSDGDGIPDGIDRCPETPRGTVVDSSGCPQVERVQLVTINDLFGENEALTPNATTKLQRLAERMRVFPTDRYEIGIYTDQEGSAEFNRRRAYRVGERVSSLLETHGVTLSQITVVQYGEAHPVTSNRSPMGVAENRRVVIKRLDK